ncbi:hypothetical protein WA026_010612 [Henosepilachna vigintioctopunctata]|uniref:Uncharacterized protein n=1 Tax=Henosepilachna vigintioctopunctata TaxID=420089 RepID=A0AAW1VDP8_9CUCU
MSKISSYSNGHKSSWPITGLRFVAMIRYEMSLRETISAIHPLAVSMRAQHVIDKLPCNFNFCILSQYLLNKPITISRCRTPNVRDRRLITPGHVDVIKEFIGLPNKLSRVSHSVNYEWRNKTPTFNLGKGLGINCQALGK